MRRLFRTAGRFLLAGIFVYSGYNMFNNAERYAKQAAAAVPMLPDEPMIAKVHGATMVVAGATFALGILPKMSARILALTLIPNTIIGHPFWKAEKPGGSAAPAHPLPQERGAVRRPALRHRRQAH